MDALTVSFARYRRHGDLDALGRVFDAVSPQLLAIALHLTGNAADAEDALQATFVVAMNKATTFDSKKPIQPWLAGILSHEARNLRRREQRRRGEPLPDVGDGSVGVGEQAEHKELVAQLRTRIDALPQEQRQVLLLQLQHGLQPAEIAEVLGVPPGTVRMRLHRGLSALRRLLPAGLVVGLFSSLSTRGLAAVRADVMQIGALEVAAGSVVAAAVGGVAMKKVMLSIVVLLAIGLTWWATLPPETDLAPSDRGGAAAHAARGSSVEHAANATDESAATDVEEVVRRADAAAPGTLLVALRGDEIMAGDNDGEFEASSSEGSGVPLAGVLVHAWRGELDKGAVDGRHLLGYTDEQGAVAFEELQPGTWRVVAHAAGKRVGGVRVTVVSPAQQASLEVHLPVRFLAGRVVDDRGRAVAGADVWAGRRSDAMGTPDTYVRRATGSAADGWFSVAYLEGERLVAASRRGYCSSRSHPIDQLGAGDIELVLGNESGVVEGVVVDDHGEPIADAAVSVEAIGDEMRRSGDGTLLGPYLTRVVRSDERGRFEVRGLAPRDYECEASRLPFDGGAVRVAVRGGKSTRVQLSMKRQVNAYGYVRTSDGAPCPGVFVSLVQDGTWRSLRTEADGSFMMGGVVGAPFRVGVTNGWGSETTWRDIDVVVAGQPLELIFEPGERVDGTLATASGKLLGDWLIDPSSGSAVKSRSDGTFSFWIPPEFEGDVSVDVSRQVNYTGKSDVALTAKVTRGQPLVLTVADELLPSATIRGRVVDKAGKPIANGYVARHDNQAPPVELGDDGTFVIGDFEAGTAWLVVHAEGYAMSTRLYQLEHGAQFDAGDLALVRSATIIVDFQRPDGTPWKTRPPIPWLRRDKGNWLMTHQVDYSLDNGAVVCAGIDPGTYTVHGPQGDELVVDPVEVTLGAGDVRRLTMRVQVGRHVTLQFDLDQGDPLLDVVVRRGDGMVVVQEPATVANGVCELQTMLPIGTFTVEAESRAGVRYGAPITVEASLDGARRFDVPRAP